MFFTKRKILYFPGCLTSAALPNIVLNYKKLFEKFKIKVTELNRKACCGAVAYNNGYLKDFEEIKGRFQEILKINGAREIVTNDPQCLHTLLHHYGRKTIHVSELISKYKNKLPVMYDEEATYYDSPRLKIYDEPREILKALGFEMIELEKNRENSILCGAEGGMIQNTPALARKIAKEVFNTCKTKKLIVSDPLTYYHLKKHTPVNIQVLELSEVFEI